MRTLFYGLIILSLSACGSMKKTQQQRVNTAYEARTEASRPTSTQPRAATLSSPSTAPPRTVDAPAAAPTVADRSSGWSVTSIKGKFLAIDSTTLHVILDMTAQKPEGGQADPAQFAEHFQIAYVMYPDYNNRERLGYGNIPLDGQTVKKQGNHLTIAFDVKRPANRTDLANAVLLTEVTEIASGNKARNDLPLRFRNFRLSDRFALTNATGQEVELRNYVNAGDMIQLSDLANTKKTLYGVRYRHDFEAASSPMNTSARPAPKSLVVDSTLTITTNQPFSLPREGLYYFTEDTTADNGIGLVVTDNRFPKMTRPEKLIRPVLYMSTSSEINEMTQAQDTKKALDRYWLSLMSGNEETARRTIKAYYDRVEDANRLFTTYKEGWKTDKGMIYIVLGPPDRIQRNREREVWVYNRRPNVSEINFTFTKKSNQFVEDHYELVRFMEYQPVWYPIVEAWRTGAIRE
ncbi:GWxTD domain-containing protein [Spirosoma rhododendri]|uniref:GWxTD domain-containing protein n=1 Tax=Spirosoma rhododendri TaxID=2728024 RepID=A0A7L5DMV0_9BACT|nr:GWxTD domain-containing protein [Spirosoma rhododendri]QJD77387.1 GWxTD domain-containing protein [Spirosoma rhododendri]